MCFLGGMHVYMQQISFAIWVVVSSYSSIEHSNINKRVILVILELLFNEINEKII